MTTAFDGSRTGLSMQAFLIFVLLDVGFLVLGFPRTYRFTRWWVGVARAAVSTAPERHVERTMAAVRTATRYYWRRGLDCLPRALTIYVLLRRRGVPATLHIGVKRYPFGAHAWVECLGDVLDDSIDDWRHEPYASIIST